MDVPQCGFCQSGMLMAAATLLKEKPQPTDAEIDEAMTNICRCGTYNRVRAAIHVVAKGANPAACRARYPVPQHREQGMSRILTSRNAEGAASRAQRAASHSRRRFLKGSAVAVGGLVVPFSIPFAAAAQEAAAPEINAWVVVRPDDTIVIRIARSEMGQGTLTGLAQLVGEELDADWSNITTEYPTPTQNLARNRVWGSFSTGGSRGIRESHEYVRKGGATARMMLVQAAADGWKVPASECTTANSRITHVPTGRTVSYGSVAEAAGKLTPPAEVKLKDPKDWKLAGKRMARLDTVEKTTGAQVYGMDLTMPGMLNAAIKDCPVFGGKVTSFDAAADREAPRRQEGRAGG